MSAYKLENLVNTHFFLGQTVRKAKEKLYQKADVWYNRQGRSA